MRRLKNFVKRIQQSARRRNALTFGFSTFDVLEPRQLLSADILTYRGDNTNTGLNANETVLTTSNVNANSFAKLYSTPVDGQVYAQPLTIAGVTITVGASQGVHDVVYVATEHDSLYAIDQHAGTILWQDSFINPAAGITSLPSFDVSGEVSPEYGITSTPVIDKSTNTLYLVANTKEVVSGIKHNVYKIHAIDLGSGAEKFGGPTTIGDTTYTQLNQPQNDIINIGPYVLGAAPDAVNGQVSFDAEHQIQRTALTLSNGTVYAMFASHADELPDHGWILGFSTANLQLDAVFNDTPNGSQGGIWQTGAGMTVDNQGNLYLITGNGDFDPTQGNYGDTFLKLAVDPSTSITNQNVNGWGLKVADYFTPFNQAALASGDIDLGSGGPVLIPAADGSAANPNLILGAGKGGTVYLVNTSNMGQFNSTSDQIVQEATFINGAWSSPALFGSTLYFITDGYASTAGGIGNTTNNQARGFPLSNGAFSTTPSSQSTDTYGYPGSTPTVSSNGSSNAILWALDPTTNQLRAYDATNLANELYNSGQAAGSRDAIIKVVKFTVPIVSNGEVFVGTSNSLNAYGLLNVPTAPAAPSNLNASSTSTSQINLSWTNNAADATAVLIEQSTDGATFTQIASLVATTTSYNVTGLQQGTTYSFRITASNAQGTSAYSNTAQATTTSLPAQFGNAGFELPKLQSGASNAYVYRPSDLFWTFNATSGVEANGSAWNAANAPEGTQAAFLQGAPSTGLGSISQTLNVTSTGTYTISFQAARRTNYGVQPIAVKLDGTIVATITPTSSSFVLYTTPGFNLTAGTHVFTFAATANATDSDSFIDAVSLNPPTAPVAPTSLTASAVSPSQINLSWTNNASNATSLLIEEAANGGAFAQVASLAASASTYSVAGLQPNTPYVFRVRAANSVGNSNYSNTVSLSTPNLGINFSSGFDATTTSLLSLNGSATLSNPQLLLTNGLTSQTSTVFTKTALPINAFTNNFQFQLTNANADGFTFTIQGNSPTTMGSSVSGGGGLGYTGIGKSVAIKFDLYNNSGEGNNSTGLYINGAAPTVPSTNLAPTGVNLHSGDVFNVVMTYDGKTLKVSITDAVTGATSTQSYSVDIAGTIGGSTAYIGFTGATGGLAARQAIRNWVYTPTPALPAGWVNQDVGAPSIPGSASYSNGVFALNGSGTGIRQASDQFQFVDQTSNGDTTFIAHLTGQTGTDSWAKSGLMFRSSSDPAASYVGVMATVGNGISFEWRNTTGAIAQYTENGTTLSAPVWLKLVRIGSAFTGSVSSDGVNYTTVGSASVVMPSALLAGLATTSHNASLTNSATFDNVSINTVTSQPATLPLPWMAGDIGMPTIAGSATYQSGSFLITGSGAGVRQGSDQFQFTDQMNSGDSTIVARLNTQNGADYWAKSGLMIRATSDPASPYVGIFNAVGAGLTFEWRTASGAIASYTESGIVPTGPVWLKLVRRGSTFTGYYSTDGVNYTSLGSASVSMAANTFIGMAVTSHNVANSNTAVFDNVSVTSP